MPPLLRAVIVASPLTALLARFPVRALPKPVSMSPLGGNRATPMSEFAALQPRLQDLLSRAACVETSDFLGTLPKF